MTEVYLITAGLTMQHLKQQSEYCNIPCGAVTVVPDELGAWLVQQRRWMNSANIMDLRQLFINLSWVNSRMRVFLYIIQLLRWVEFNAGLGICFGKSSLP